MFCKKKEKLIVKKLEVDILSGQVSIFAGNKTILSKLSEEEQAGRISCIFDVLVDIKTISIHSGDSPYPYARVNHQKYALLPVELETILSILNQSFGKINLSIDSGDENDIIIAEVEK